MSIEELIKQSVRFEGNSKGWYHCRCRLCNDYKVRASFNFTDAKIKYNCFNCGTSASFTNNSTFISKEFKEVLTSFYISENDIDLCLGKNFFSKDQIIQAKKRAEEKIQEIELPPESYIVREVNESDPWTIVAKEYLDSRGLSLSDYDWYISNDKQYRDRLIIPFYKDNKLIYWQARSYIDEKKRYLSPGVPIEPILFNYDELYRHTQEPLFIMEGAFDAISIGGVGLLGSKLYKQRLEALKKSKRRKIFVIDKKDKENNGYNLGKDAIKHGWEL